jgi:transposase
MADNRSPHPSQRRYPPELRERAVRVVLETIEQTGERLGVITRVARQLGIGSASLRGWVRQAEVDGGRRPGMTTANQQRITELERQVRELRRANDIVQAASAFFAGARPSPAEMTRFIGTHREEFGVEPICTLLQVAPSTYYAQRTRPLSARALRDAQRKVEIKRVWDANYQVTAPRRSGGSSAGKPSRSAATTSPGSWVSWASVELSAAPSGGPPPRPPATSARPSWSTATSLPRRPIACGSPSSPTWPPGPGSPTWRLSSTPSPA